MAQHSDRYFLEVWCVLGACLGSVLLLVVARYFYALVVKLGESRCKFWHFLIISGTQIVIFDARWQSGGSKWGAVPKLSEIGAPFSKKT